MSKNYLKERMNLLTKKYSSENMSLSDEEQARLTELNKITENLCPSVAENEMKVITEAKQFLNKIRKEKR
jgi:hypothetical protein